MSEKEASAALDALQADERSFNKGALILHAGETTDRMGLVLDGSVTANEKCRILFLRSGNIQSLMDCPDPWALKYTTNLLTISARKNLMLSGRSFHTAPKTIRGRVLS